MIFGRKNKDESRLKKVDGLVTGVIIAGALAGIVGLSKTKKGKEVVGNIKEKNKGNIKKTKKVFSKGYELLGKTIAKGVSIFNKK